MTTGTQKSITHGTDSSTLADVLERILDKGMVIAGDIKINLVDIELLTIQIRLLICSVDKAKEMKPLPPDMPRFRAGQDGS